MKLAFIAASLLTLQGGAEHARWEEWIELDLHRSVLTEAATAFKAGEPDPKLLALAARAAAASGDLDRAERWLSAGEGPAIQVERARNHLAADRIDEALAICLAPGEPPRARYAEIADGWILPGRALARAGELERARPLLEEMIERFPHDDEVPAVLHLLAQTAIARGDLEVARTMRDRAQKSARWRELFDARRKQILAHPSDPLPRFGVAALWLDVGEAQRALTALDALLKSTPSFARGHALRGDAARALGDLDLSLKSWSRALSLDADLHAARFNRALVLLARERWQEAQADLEILVLLEEAKREPLLQAHLHLATTLEALGDAKGAQAARARHAKIRAQIRGK